MSEKGKKAGIQKLVEKRRALIEQLWGEELEQLTIWNRKEHDGWTTLPRTIPQLNRIMDKLAGKGTPVSSAYLSLWCNVHDEGFIDIKDKHRFAFESGFSGERAVTTWSNRMKKLEKLGFISTKSGSSGVFNYVLILNPFQVVKSIYKVTNKDDLYNALVGRMNDVGAKFDE